MDVIEHAAWNAQATERCAKSRQGKSHNIKSFPKLFMFLEKIRLT